MRDLYFEFTQSASTISCKHVLGVKFKDLSIYMVPKLISLDSFGEQGKGVLTVAVIGKDVPFDVKRVVWIYGVEDSNERGNHANKETIQVFAVVHGEIEVKLIDEMGKELIYVLNDPSQGLVVPPEYYRTLVFGKGAVLVAINSKDYEESDYVRDLNQFLKK